MQLIKKLFANPYLKKFVFSYNWALIGLLIAVLLVCLLIFLIIKRRKNAKAAAKPEIKKEEQDLLSPVSLLQIWKTFLKNIPVKFRRSILMYQPYIVMGESGTGKTDLIDNYTNWKNQANQFYPSHIQDELVQIYLGTRIIIQEISAVLLHDTSASARKALDNLWKIFKKKKDLIVVIVLKGDELIQGDPDFFREQAQMMRGKINILSEILKRPVKIRMALTFMNHVKGFSEFFAFMHNNNIPFELEINEQSDLDNLKNAVSAYEQYFSNALISESAEDYLKILSFCRTAPSILSTLSRFIKILTAPDPLSSSPRINSVFFTSDTVNEDLSLSNPFKTRVPIKKVRDYNPMRKHKIAALLLMGVGITYMLYSYSYQKNYIRQIMVHLNEINSSILKNNTGNVNSMYPGFAIGVQPSVQPVQQVKSLKHPDMIRQRGIFIKGGQDKNFNSGNIVLYTIPARKNDLLFKTGKTDEEIYTKTANFLNNIEKQSEKTLNNKLLIDFFPDAQSKIHGEIINARQNLKEQIIKKIFQPKLVDIKIKQNAYHKNLLILSLIYSSKSDALGRLIKDHIDLWAKLCSINPHIIETYLSLSNTSWNKIIPVKNFIKKQSHQNTNRYVTWLIFLQNINQTVHEKFVNPRSLANLQQEALKITSEINDSLRNDWFNQLKQLLGSETTLGKVITYNRIKQISIKKDYINFEIFLNFSRKLSLDSPEVKDINLEQLFENLRVMMKLKKPETKEFNFVINKQKFQFDSDELYDLIANSNITILLRNYVSYYGRFPGVSFFHQNSEYKDLAVDISSDDNFYFSKKAAINGRYTKKTYDRDVMPVLKALPELLEKLPVSETDKKYFSSFMFREVEAYIHNYILSYENYYKGFSLSADSVGELRYILTQMTLPMNQFQEFLRVMNNNISLDYADNPYFNLIKSRMRPLKFISFIMQEQKGQYPELEKYKAILRQLLSDLVSSTPVVMDESEGNAGILKSRLSPVARISLDIFLNGPGSYLRMIQKWGTSVGIPDQWLYPFTEPVYQTYLLGQKKIQTAIKKEWENLKADYVSPVIDKFPFNPEATSFVTPEDLKNLACSTGGFWKKFSKEIAPLCIKTPDGKWHERSFVMSSLKFPEMMFKELNYISQLSGIFFDKKAEPVPLVFEIRPHPLPLIQNKMILVVLSYIRTGKTSVFGFNQQPAWQKFPIVWWKPTTSSAGVEFMQRGGSSKKMFASITVQNSYWSFYRLLKNADTPEPLTWMWDIESPGGIKWKRAISFSIKNNPWSVFKKSLLNGKQ